MLIYPVFSLVFIPILGDLPLTVFFFKPTFALQPQSHLRAQRQSTVLGVWRKAYGMGPQLDSLRLPYNWLNSMVYGTYMYL